MADRRDWDYRVVNSNLQICETEFRSVGRAGWELVSVINDRNSIIGFFKRERDPLLD